MAIKKLVSNTSQQRKRVQLKCPEKSITNQSMKGALSMASISEKLLKKGIAFPSASDVFYSTAVQPKNLQETLDFMKETSKSYEALPYDLKKLMNFDIKNFESVLLDEKNADVLKKSGLVKIERDGVSEIVKAVKELSEDEISKKAQAKLDTLLKK